MTTSKRILIVEDETIVAMDLASTLRRLGYAVVGIHDAGESAVDSARSTTPDLILMDIRLKGTMDGIEAASNIHRELGTPIVFLTAHADVDTVERSKSAVPFGYLIKPFDERSLHRAVEIALNRAEKDEIARQKALDILWQSEERFRLLVDAVKDYALFMIDLQGRIASWNSGAERMTGFSGEDVLGASVGMLRPANSPAEDLDHLFERVRREGFAEWEEAGIRKNGSSYLAHIHCTPLLDRRGDLLGYVIVRKDVTEERRLQQQLAQAQRFESLGQLAGGVAHDFNNMLMVIFSRCEFLMRSVESEKVRRHVADIRAAAGKNRDLTQQLLAASRRQVLDPAVVHLNEVIHSAMQLLAPTLGEHITIREELQESLWSVYADPGKLHQVLLNLAINARDAMAPGGMLTIESRNVHVDASYARQHVGLHVGDYVLLVVTDSGSGIPAHIRDRIYDPFFTTKEPGRGTGLGLAVVRGIVEQTGGRVWMYSEEGRGTAFKIFLPRHLGAVGETIVVDEGESARGTETILLAEDEDLLRTVLCESLEEHGYRVLAARTPAEALAISRAFRDPIHVLLTDMIMPGMTGRDLAQEIAVARPRVPVIFMSGYSNNAMMHHDMLPPGTRYLEKPIATMQLLRAIRTALDVRQ